MIKSFFKSFKYMCSCFSDLQLISCSSRDYFSPVLDKTLKKLFEVKKSWLCPSFSESDSIETETCLKRRHLVDLVENLLWKSIFFELYDDSYSIFIRFISQVRNTNYFFVTHKICDFFNET